MKPFFSTALLLLVTPALFGQTQDPKPKKGLNNQLEVTRNYEPAISDVLKLDLTPDLNDTLQLRPEIQYTTAPRPLMQAFQIVPIKPAIMREMALPSFKPFYLKVGAGVPLQTILDFYFSSTQKKNGYYGAYFNHYGQYAKIRNDQGNKIPATVENDKIGFFGQHRMGRFVIDADITYRYDQVARYGFYYFDEPLPETFDNSRDALRQCFHNIGGNISFGNDFSDPSRLNWRFSINPSYYKDRFKNGETGLTAGFEIGKLLGGQHNLALSIQYDRVRGHGTMKESIDDIVSFAPFYNVSYGRFSFGAGFKYMLETGVDIHHFYPELLLEYDAGTSCFAPYLHVSGHLFGSNYLENPYLAPDVILPNTSEQSIEIGFRGDCYSKVTYNLTASWSKADSVSFYANLYGGESLGNMFGYITDNADIWRIGAQIDWIFHPKLTLHGDFKYTKYNLRHLQYAGGIPQLQGSIVLKYASRQKIFVNISAKIRGEQYCYETAISDNVWGSHRIPPQIDLSIDATYQFRRKFGVFLNIDNIANQNLYLFNRYKRLGINAMTGIKVTF